MPKNKINYDKLLDGVQEVIQRGDYIEFLKAIKTLKNDYSLRNTILVYSQFPRAKYVKGFVDWNKLGRGVKKNPRTIYIYAPIKYKKKRVIEGQQNVKGKEEKERDNSGTIEIIEGPTYKRIAVYDISNTYVKKGVKRIPILDDVINNNTTKDIYNILLKISPVNVVIRDDLGMTKGVYSKKRKVIELNANLSQDDKTSVLIHELCHCLYDDFAYEKERDMSEIFVESVAFLVADYFNFDTGICSFGYITNWAKGDIRKFMSIANKIKETADQFIQLIKDNEFEQEKISA